MGTENFQNKETKKDSQNMPSFDEIREKVIKLNKEEYKEKTYKVGTKFSLSTTPYFWVKTKKVNQRGENINKFEKKGRFGIPGMEFGYTKMGKKEKERLISDKQEMSQLILDLGDLYGLDLSDKVILSVNEENGSVIISYNDFLNSSIKNSANNFVKDSRVDMLDNNTECNIQIICNGEKAIRQINGKVESEFKIKTPEVLRVCKDFNDIYYDLYEEITYTNQSGIECSIGIIGNNSEKIISILEGEDSYSLKMIINGDFELIKEFGDKRNVINHLSPEDVIKALHNIQEKINEGRTINAQKITEIFDEIQENEGNEAEQKLNKDLEGM